MKLIVTTLILSIIFAIFINFDEQEKKHYTFRFLHELASIKSTHKYPRANELKELLKTKKYNLMNAVSPTNYLTTKYFTVGSISAVQIKKPETHSRKDIPTLLWFHGGFLVNDSMETYISSLSYFVYKSNDLTSDNGRDSLQVVLVDYTKYPRKSIEEIKDEFKSIYRSITYDLDPRYLLVGGEDMAAGLIIRFIQELIADDYQIPPGLFFISPWIDYDLSGESYKNKEDIISEDSLKDLLNQNMFIGPKWDILESSFQNFPPIHIVVGDEEILLSDSEKLYSKAEKEGVFVSIGRIEGGFKSYAHFGAFSSNVDKIISNATLWIQKETNPYTQRLFVAKNNK